MYQIRLSTGEIYEIASMEEVEQFILDQDSPLEIEKLSFTGPDGTRIRILDPCNGPIITYWSDTSARYVELP